MEEGARIAQSTNSSGNKMYRSEHCTTRGRLRSPERLAAVLERPEEEVGKVVVYEGAGGAVAAVVPAGQVVDPDRVRSASGRPDLAPATDDRATQLTEYLPESLPPVGLP